MSERTSKQFDCVDSMRTIRDRLSVEIADMDYVDLIRWLREYEYDDPLLQDLAQEAVQRVENVDRLPSH